jgi:hypothetical protein
VAPTITARAIVAHRRPYTLPAAATISDKMMVAGISAQTFSRARPRAKPLAELQNSNVGHICRKSANLRFVPRLNRVWLRSKAHSSDVILLGRATVRGGSMSPSPSRLRVVKQSRSFLYFGQRAKRPDARYARRFPPPRGPSRVSAQLRTSRHFHVAMIGAQNPPRCDGAHRNP